MDERMKKMLEVSRKKVEENLKNDPPIVRCYYCSKKLKKEEANILLAIPQSYNQYLCDECYRALYEEDSTIENDEKEN